MSANELLLIGIGVVAGLLLATIVFLCARPARTRKPEPAASPRRVPLATSPANEITSSSTIRVTSTDDKKTIEINGVPYRSVDEVPDPVLRERARQAVATLSGPGAAAHRIEIGQPTDQLHVKIGETVYPSVDEIPDPAIRQHVKDWLAKNPTTKSLYSSISIDRMNDNLRIQVDGIEYRSVDEIPDASVRDIVRRALESV